MRVRLCAMMRKPAPSMMALIAPVKLRAVASGLMIEKVRSIAIALFFKGETAGEPIAAAYSERAVARQGVTKACVHQARPLGQRPKRQRRRAPLQRGGKPRRVQTHSRLLPFPRFCADFLSWRH